MTPQQERKIAETGAAQALVDAQNAMAALERTQKDKEKRVAALSPEFKGAKLLSQCESYLRLASIVGGSQAAPHGSNAQEWADLNYSAATCMHYIDGVFDSLTQNTACYTVLLKKPMHPIACVPDGVTVDQVIRVVEKFLRDHPERLHQLRYELVRDALWAAFPCPKQ